MSDDTRAWTMVRLNGVAFPGMSSIDYAPERPPAPPSPGLGTYHASGTFTLEPEAYQHLCDALDIDPPVFEMTFTWKKRIPKPTPRQVRLKRRAAGAKRRAKARR